MMNSHCQSRDGEDAGRDAGAGSRGAGNHEGVQRDAAAEPRPRIDQPHQRRVDAHDAGSAQALDARAICPAHATVSESVHATDASTNTTMPMR